MVKCVINHLLCWSECCLSRLWSYMSYRDFWIADINSCRPFRALSIVRVVFTVHAMSMTIPCQSLLLCLVVDICGETYCLRKQ